MAMPPRMRAAVVLRYLHDMTVDQTADALNCSKGNVKSQTARGLQHLRDALGVELDGVSYQNDTVTLDCPPTNPAAPVQQVPWSAA